MGTLQAFSLWFVPIETCSLPGSITWHRPAQLLYGWHLWDTDVGMGILFTTELWRSFSEGGMLRQVICLGRVLRLELSFFAVLVMQRVIDKCYQWCISSACQYCVAASFGCRMPLSLGWYFYFYPLWSY
jgi:hypothetical protein